MTERGIEKQQEIDELKAHVGRLREAVSVLNKDIRDYETGKLHMPFINLRMSLSQFMHEVNETPAQSLNHIRAQVEEETIEYDAKLMDADHNGYAASRIRERERKYQEQSDACSYPDCRCPFDAPADSNWCAKGLRKEQSDEGGPGR